MLPIFMLPPSMLHLSTTYGYASVEIHCLNNKYFTEATAVMFKTKLFPTCVQVESIPEKGQFRTLLIEDKANGMTKFMFAVGYQT